MPYLRMFLDEQKLDEAYISDVVLHSVIGQFVINEEKEKMLEKNENLLSKSTTSPSFRIEPS